MQVSVRFNTSPVFTPTEPLEKWLTRIPERVIAPLAEIYNNVFVYGTAAYLVAVVAIFARPGGPHMPYGAGLLLFAATAWIPPLALYVGLNAMVRFYLKRRLDLQQQAMDELEREFSDVISESVAMVVEGLDVIRAPSRAPADNDS